MLRRYVRIHGIFCMSCQWFQYQIVFIHLSVKSTSIIVLKAFFARIGNKLNIYIASCMFRFSCFDFHSMFFAFDDFMRANRISDMSRLQTESNERNKIQQYLIVSLLVRCLFNVPSLIYTCSMLWKVENI